MEDEKKILNEMSTEELKNTEHLTNELLEIIRQNYTQTKRRLFNNNLYVELLLFKKQIENELIRRKRLE